MKEFLENTKCQVHQCKEKAHYFLYMTFPNGPQAGDEPKHTIPIALCYLHSEEFSGADTAYHLREIIVR